MAPKYVRGEGPLHAKLMVVGEAPGYYEDQEGRPFVGPSGGLLNKFLSDAGVNRSEVYVTNVVKYRPPNNELRRLKELGITIESGLPELWDEIKAVNPNCIIALGNTPLRYLVGRHGKGNGITENRGSIFRLIGGAGTETKVVPTYHPANLLHMAGGEVFDPKVRLWMEHDFQRAVEESKHREYNIPRRNLWIARNSLDVWRFLERQRGRKRVSIDIEVTRAIPICIGLAFDSFEAMSVPLLDFDSPYHTGKLCSSPRDVADSLMSIGKFLHNSDLEIIGQNFKFDHSKLEINCWFKILGRILDVMLMHHTLYPEFPKSLGFMTSIHTREPYYKIEGREYVPGRDKLEDFLIYNARDAAVTFELAEVLLQELEDFGLTEFYFGFQKDNWRYPFGVEKLHELYMRMESVGFRYSKEKNTELKRKYKDKLIASQLCLDALVGAKVNVNSWKQVDYLLYEHLKMPKRAGTSEDVLVALRNSPAVKNEDHKKIIDYILEIRRIRKTISTYLNAGVDFDGRMRTQYKIVGTNTGRTATEMLDPPLRPWPQGLAFQTMTKHGDIGPDLRKQFIVDNGYVFLNADSKQAEARVVFLLARLYDRLKQMDDPKYDIHSHTASWFYSGETPEEIRKQKDKRFTGKTIRHAGHLGMQKNRCMHTFNNDAKKFGIDAQISEWKAGKLLEAFHENDPNIEGVFQKEIADAVNETKVLISPFGRRREFFGDPEENSQFYKEVYSFLPQATIADNTKRAMLGIREDIPEIRFILEWHDGFLALVPESEVQAYARVFVRHMEKAIDFSECTISRDYRLTIPCELELSETNFYDLKAYELA